MTKLNQRSLDNLKGVHPDLVRVVMRAAELSPVPFVVTEGLRTLERQKQLKAAGKSWTLNSRHLTGHAVDVVDANDFKYDIPDMTMIAVAMKDAAKELGVPIVWGGDWKVRDTPHFELDKSVYPANGVGAPTRIAEKAVDVVTSKPVLVGTGVAGGGAAVSTDTIPAPPDLSPYTAWKGFGQTLVDLGGWIASHPVLSLSFIAWIGCLFYWPQVKEVGRRVIKAALNRVPS